MVVPFVVEKAQEICACTHASKQDQRSTMCAAAQAFEPREPVDDSMVISSDDDGGPTANDNGDRQLVILDDDDHAHAAVCCMMQKYVLSF